MMRWILLLLLTGRVAAEKLHPEQLEFFESRIRPILAQDCYECHRTGGKKKGGLALDHREAMREGGDTEDLFDFDDPGQSYLLKVIRHEEEGMEMPKDGVKLDDRIIGDFEAWIKMGAPDPRDSPPSDEEVSKERSWDQVMQRRKQWWSFQPIQETSPPSGDGSPIDRFLNRRIKEAGLEAVDRAEDRVLVRRLSYALRGLPPSIDEVRAFLEDSRPNRWEHLVDEFLTSPRFGERWARHWMDWIRYADSHGSEGDPGIRNSWRYRDYLIRALNDNIPYDTLVMEHLAGDLLESPRIVDGRNESAHGPGHLRMVFHGFAPTDALDEKVRFTDDQINVVTKTFQGLTVSCARCHNHKFDAISQEDYYAFFGIFGSTKPGVVRVDAVDEGATRDRMKELKKMLKGRLLGLWTDSQPEWTERFLAEAPTLFANGRKKEDFLFLRAWHELQQDRNQFVDSIGEGNPREDQQRSWEGRELTAWSQHGEELPADGRGGEFSITPDGESLVEAIFPPGLYSGAISHKDRGILLSPRMQLTDKEEVWMKVRGTGNAVVRYAVQNYPRNGTVFPSSRLNDGKWKWIRHDLDYWKGDRIHLELTTSRDQAILAGNDDRSSVAISAAMVIKKGTGNPPQAEWQGMRHFLGSRLEEDESLSAFLNRLTLETLRAWSENDLGTEQAVILDELLKIGILPNQSSLGGSLLEDYRRLEASLAVPVRAPGVWEADAHDQEFFERGNHKKPSEPVKRRFLEAFDNTPYDTDQSGRLELARDFLRSDNPFTARVLVNRVWHHLFGSGLVRTTDNFGRLGEAPSHPALLDYLAAGFVDQGWDLKKLIREIVLTDAWQRASVPGSRARERDPDNRLLSHFSLRRLEAEAIRDTLIAVSGTLDQTAFGNPVDGNSGRRSVYVRNQRNRLDPFLQTFNAPVPLGGKGRRDETNVPAQSLTLLNSGRVLDLARQWAGRMEGDSPGDQIRHAYEVAYARTPSEKELQQVLDFMELMEKGRKAMNEDRTRLEQEIAQLEGKVAALEAEGRSRLGPQDNAEVKGPVPVARWDFEEDARDQAGSWHGQLHGGAEISDGGLVVGKGNGYFTSVPLDRDLGEKTLQVLVKLDRLDQGGGGALGIQTLDGDVFDSIVYAEKDAGEWLPGSEFHRRTQSPDGDKETQAAQNPVWITMTYSRDGAITVYRNAVAYGRSYRTGNLQSFEKGQAQVIMGNRHGPPGAGRLLFGRIDEARVFDRALAAEEVALSIGMQMPPSRQEILGQLTKEERVELLEWETRLEVFRSRLSDLNRGSLSSDPLVDFAHALMNSKELIYVR